MCRYLCWMMFGLFLLYSPQAWALDKPCRALFKQKQYKQAASCFLKLLPVVDKKKELGTIVPLMKDRFLRFASVSLHRAAKAETASAEKAFLKEQAIKHLLHSFQKGYCESARKCRTNRLFADQLKKEIRYSSLVIITGSPTSTLQVTGYKFSATTKGTFNKQLRPGTYKVLLTFPNKQPAKRTVTLKPNTTKTLNATPDKIIMKEKRIYIAKKLPPIVLVSYIVGGVFVVTGAVIGGLGFGELQEYNKLNDDLDYRNEKYPPTKDAQGRTVTGYGESEEKAERAEYVNLMIIAGATLGVGVAIVIGGLIMHNVASNNKQKPKEEIRNLSSLRTRPTFVLST
ncbi:MAG TPA: hypothetical protein DCE42_19620, partial [Myxococcales bacterium]|nr:hypothetical protein [Myxococcales bacterium]